MKGLISPEPQLGHQNDQLCDLGQSPPSSWCFPVGVEGRLPASWTWPHGFVQSVTWGHIWSAQQMCSEGFLLHCVLSGFLKRNANFSEAHCYGVECLCLRVFEFSKLILELTIFVVVCPWEIGESCLTLDNEVIMSNLGATAATFQNNHGISIVFRTRPVSLLN